MKENNILVGVLAVIGVVLLGVCLMLGVSNCISVAIGPLTAQVGELTGVTKEINRRLTALEARQTALAPSNGAPAQVVNAQGPCGGAPSVGGPPPVDYNKVYTIPIGSSPVLGKRDAPVTIVAFMDFQCPFCTQFYPPIEQVQKQYPDKVNVVIKNFPLPFHPNALGAAKLALAANQQGKYFQMVDLLLANQGANTDDKVEEYAKTLRINANRLLNDFKNKDAQWQKFIDDDKILVNEDNVGGTPTIFINGRLTQARDVNSYKAEIDKILSEKK